MRWHGTAEEGRRTHAGRDLLAGGDGHRDGRLRIGWSVERSEGQADFLNLTWSETGGPAVSPPEKQGFGTRLIDFAIARDLGGSLDRAYEQDGLRVEARFPL